MNLPAAPQTFEAQLKALEQLVSQLERNELPLQEALAAYAKGTELIAACQQLLAQAETTVQEIASRATSNVG
ncbi:MAG: exodeoxyribonuclease VII small subunit [Alphaproteobacteria bacterium]|jgi:exodeoxyribonuclease VII small subunit|nr:exodeoxyribonuclease VII small subunit [Alphaproteobacteria bacterium]